jgi:hypothetical protein
MLSIVFFSGFHVKGHAESTQVFQSLPMVDEI